MMPCAPSVVSWSLLRSERQKMSSWFSVWDVCSLGRRWKTERRWRGGADGGVVEGYIQNSGTKFSCWGRKKGALQSNGVSLNQIQAVLSEKSSSSLSHEVHIKGGLETWKWAHMLILFNRCRSVDYGNAMSGSLTSAGDSNETSLCSFYLYIQSLNGMCFHVRSATKHKNSNSVWECKNIMDYCCIYLE